MSEDLKMEKQSTKSSGTYKTISRTGQSHRSRRSESKMNILNELEKVMEEKENILRQKMALLDARSDTSSNLSAESYDENPEPSYATNRKVMQWVQHQEKPETPAQELALKPPPRSKKHEDGGGGGEGGVGCSYFSTPANPSATTLRPVLPTSVKADSFQPVLPMEKNSSQPQEQVAPLSTNHRDSTNRNAPETSIEISCQNVIEKLAMALDNNNNTSSSLPHFNGNINDWLMFKASFLETHMKISRSENIRRLRAALRGEAREAVAALLHSNAEPEVVMRMLEQRFAHPAVIAHQQMKEIGKCKVYPISVFSCKINNFIAMAKALKLQECLSNSEIYNLILSKMDKQMCGRWIDYAAANNVTTEKLEAMGDFLQRETELSGTFLVGMPSQPVVTSNPVTSNPRERAYSVSVSAESMPSQDAKSECSFCKDNHSIVKCAKFIELDFDSRWKFVRDNKKCFRCLQFSHPAIRCKLSKSLNKLLRKPRDVPEAPQGQQATVLNIESENSQVGALLKVVPITIKGKQGSISTFALLDEGATVSLIDEGLALQLGVTGPAESLHITGIGSSEQHIKTNIVKVQINGSNSEIHEVKLRTMPDFKLQSQYLEKNSLLNYEHIRKVESNITWYTNGTPKILIGQDYWYLIVSRKLHMGAINEPVVSETLLGFVVHGAKTNTPALVAYIGTCSPRSADEDLHRLIKDSFDLDNIGIVPKQRSNSLEERALNILEQTTRKIDERTWETGLIWKEKTVFPDTEKLAYKRFNSLLDKFQKDPVLAQNYTAQMHRFVDQGFAVKNEGMKSEGNKWLLPHFPVINPNKPGKIRPVFDAAAKCQGVSLNDNLLPGPVILQNMLGILWKFREKPIAVSADIKDMFLKIKIRKEDQPFQQYLWKDPGEAGPPELHTMTSMLFGATCSPTSAIFVKNRNAEQYQDIYPRAVDAIIRKHYCDDYLDCFDSPQEAKEVISQVREIHASGGFDLCGFASNSTVALESVPLDRRAPGCQHVAFSGGEQKTLGMRWQPGDDVLSFNLEMNRVPKEISSGRDIPTKRQMLAVTMSLFDPIGLLSPLSIKGKILLQEVWRTNISWDQKLQDKEFQKWKVFISDLQQVKYCLVPRSYVTRSNYEKVQIHTFCDASIKAYAAACYFRFQYPNGEIKVVLIAAKARVTPVKPISIPRLELQAAVLGARLANTVIKNHDIEVSEQFYWSDSGTTIAWIRSDPRNYKPYVGHRLSAIDELTMVSQWHWIPTGSNAADIPTREHPLDWSMDGMWFSGPEFLKKNEDEWPVEDKILTAAPAATCEKKKEQVNVIKVKEYCLPDVSRFSSWLSLVRCTAYVLLFIEKMLKKEGASKLTVDLLNKAEKIWIKKTQEDSYPEELHYLKKKEDLPSSSKLLQLTPILDDEGIMKVRGRIDATPGLSEEQKRPIILCGGHPYTKLLVRRYHTRYNHGSTETVVNELRQKYWVTNLRSTVRSVAHSCQHCKIRRASLGAPPMGDLPLCRLDHHKRPFTHTGLDYFGPLEVAIGRRREKRYGALFTCMVTRAVHMEIAASLTADSVIMAIRRMMARRGSPTDIYSDNGSNFHGAETELKKALKEMNQDTVHEDLMNRGIRWHFIPASAPHMGGAWERMVQAIKKSLYATLRERAPKEEVLSTLMLEAENVVNSRPLTHVSVDPRDEEAITPNHFLIGSSGGSPVPGSFDDKDLLRHKQWKVTQRLADLFWSRFVREYIPTLQHRAIVTKPQENVTVNDLVIVCDGTLPRNVWPRGIVVKTYPGKDQRVRVVDVKTAGGVFRRPVHKLLILPVKDDYASVADSPGDPPVDGVGRASSSEARQGKG